MNVDFFVVAEFMTALYCVKSSGLTRDNTVRNSQILCVRLMYIFKISRAIDCIFLIHA